MDRKPMAYTEHFERVMEIIRTRGLLLAARGPDGRPNAMTIGWGSIGTIWSMPMWIVLVRPSRFTYTCIEHAGAFSVNVPGADLAKACSLCGTRSGRDMDKLAAAGLTIEPGQNGDPNRPYGRLGSPADVPVIAECPVVYECQVVHRNDVAPGALVRELVTGPYANGDYHRIYFGRILSAHAAADAAERLTK